MRRPVPGIQAVVVRKTKKGHDVDAYGQSRSARQSFEGGIAVVIDADGNERHLIISGVVTGGLGSGLIHPFAVFYCGGRPRFARLHLPEEGTRARPKWPTC